MLCGEHSPEADVSHLRPCKSDRRGQRASGSSPCGASAARRSWHRLEGSSPVAVATLDAMSQADFDAPSWTPAGADETYGRFMRIRHFDCFMHEHDIRFALGAAASQTADDLGSALDEVSTGLGYIVGRRAGLPDGSTVRIDLSGPVARTSWSRWRAGRRWSTRWTGPPPSVSICRPALPAADRGA